MKRIFAGLMLAIAVLATGCTRITTGEVGLRVNASKQVEGAELREGSWNQTFIGDVLTFPVRDIAVNINDKAPLTADNTPLADLDFTAIYGINENAVSDLWTKKSKTFHSNNDEDDVVLMYNYVGNTVNSAAYKVVRKYNALTVNDKREDIAKEIKEEATKMLAADGLANSLSIHSIIVKSVVPNKQILDSAIAVVRAENELKEKEKQVAIAEAESRRMAALAANSEKSIQMMDAQARLAIAQGIREGKVNTIVIPADFKGMVNVK